MVTTRRATRRLTGYTGTREPARAATRGEARARAARAADGGAGARDHGRDDVPAGPRAGLPALHDGDRCADRDRGRDGAVGSARRRRLVGRPAHAARRAAAVPDRRDAARRRQPRADRLREKHRDRGDLRGAVLLRLLRRVRALPRALPGPRRRRGRRPRAEHAGDLPRRRHRAGAGRRRAAGGGRRRAAVPRGGRGDDRDDGRVHPGRAASRPRAALAHAGARGGGATRPREPARAARARARADPSCAPTCSRTRCGRARCRRSRRSSSCSS